MKKEKIKVYLYTRVSTTMQIDGYSLDAQKTKMKAFYDYNEYEIAGEYEDKHYQRRKTDLENHLYKTYDKIDEAEELLVSAKVEKREFLSQLVDNVQIYEERKENGQWLKSIEFKLPIIEKEFTLSLDNDTQNETVCLLSRKN